ncbi:Mth938-like domain-containing protein [Bartonella sp. DGB1]|uniref:Mth938-like domain-containing protein n=1 Tax=Bartonella sp. DGB1 TaxID=3239807 RepID=UPI00352476D4
MGSAINIREAYLPGTTPIDSYGNGGFSFAKMSHKGSIICLPSGIYSWSPTSCNFTIEMLDRVFLEADQIEILLLGTGKELHPVNNELKKQLQKFNISADAMNTGAAVRTYNVLLAEDRAVAAAFYAVD